MSNNERIYKIDQLLNDRKNVSFKELMDRLEVSPATLKRDLAYMRDRLNAPIIYDRDLNGYKFENQPNLNQYELPGLWFTAEEIYSLLTMEHLLLNIDKGGLLTPHVKPLLARLKALIDSPDSNYSQIKKRIRIEAGVGAREFHSDNFQLLGFAVINRKQLTFEYNSRSTGEQTLRQVSPQRLVYYRGTGIDAWCNLRNGLRSFSIDRICNAILSSQVAKDIDEAVLDEELSSGYGIFSGKDVKWAILKFNPTRSKWVSEENWHPDQKSRILEDGSYELQIPYSDERELLMDILKYGSDVEVIEPKALKHAVIKALSDNLSKYKNI